MLRSWVPTEIMEIFYKAWPTGTWHGRVISPHFQSVYRKFPINNCLVFPPLNLFSNKPKPLEKVRLRRLDSVNIQKIVIECFPHHCFSDECLQATSWFWLQTLFVVEKLFCPREFSLSSNFLDRDSWIFSCVFFPLWVFFTGNNNNTKIPTMWKQ